ncbi:50S ribosomal protein L3 [Campylobacter pinnipediorum]|uniref:50S ribosomal protein L3 n=2 Tax=Campylobacter pinnipediorum TaxID=1965231 RepID=A0A1S6U5K3_9BACT|nr:50S ribosomal protein L3 [Campylobacter pinnipediorum]AQW80486.1 50S ribosomal protein L3 [Campylobacter pinnipediorum subsp. pinnipediorum]AQW82155.1 50S ribosomal protein L3 [Campylobacter pinnipediorum subsp. pinnipediorum]AQW83832.1 50S ribosomal protein L3 [Campylobacter pinnipediorum subsp. pinnipediorum]AQW85351.1 50S ribosomal protein L3 [Campylobacter pinnipediorum subsp. caledonicus]AQW86960.1 50S ribosomal protein L3 [Campylobacter pinnipediorum subsp. caledonicus]
MEYIVEKIGMSRTVAAQSIPVTLLKLVDTKVCEIDENKRAIVAYADTKANNKSIQGQQKKYNLTAEFNKFATIEVANSEVGAIDVTPLSEAKVLKVSFNSKGRGYQGVVKRHGFAGGPKSHGSRFHRRHGSIGNCEWPGRVQPGMKMAGHMGNEKVTVKNELVSFDNENGIIVVKGCVPGYNGAMGRIRIVK